MDKQANQSYPRAILHVDGDSFFVSCELTRRPGLRGRPVITGANRGIATAMSPEAKKIGIVRGMRTRYIRSTYPQTVILEDDHRLYAQYASRMYSIVRRYTDVVEEYSIDECFADLTGVSARPGPAQGLSYEEIALAIQRELHVSLGITFSVGLGVNKVTAKIASKWRKPAGSTFMPREAIPEFIGRLAIGKVWGIGSATTLKLRKLGIVTAADLAGKDRGWVAEHCDRPLAEIYEELHGAYLKELENDRQDPISIQHTRSFHPPTRERAFLWSQLSHHVEEACTRLRHKGLVASRVSFFLKTQDFSYMRSEVGLPELTASPEAVLAAVMVLFENTIQKYSEAKFRATGVSFMGLRSPDAGTATLFGVPASVKRSTRVHEAVDRLARKFGKHSVFLGSSLRALKFDGSLDEPTGRDRTLDIIYLGEVR